jgi:hypothetical protein
MSKLVPDNMRGIFSSIVVESADVHPKNRQYGFLGTLKGTEDQKRKHVTAIAPHVKNALKVGLAKHQESDAQMHKLYGLKTSSSKRREKMKVTNRTVEHFLDSVHGRHIADSLNDGKQHHANPGSLHSRAHHFMRDYEPSVHENYDQFGAELTEENIGKRESHNINVARSVYHAQLQTQGLTVSCPEYIKKMQDFLAGYKNGSSVAENHEIVTVNWNGDVWNDDIPYDLEEAVKGTGEVKSEIHKHVKKLVGKSGTSLKGTISNIDHHEDGTSTVNIRHTKPQTENVVKMLRDWRYAHNQGVRDKAGEVLNSKTSSPGHYSLGISTSPLSGGWYHTKVHVTTPKNIKEQLELLEKKLSPEQIKKRDDLVSKLPEADFKKRYGDKAKDVMYATATKRALGEEIDEEELKEYELYKGSDDDDEVVPGSTAMAASQIGDSAGGMSESTPSPDNGPAKRLTTENAVVSTSQENEPTDGEQDDLPSGLGEEFFIEEFTGHAQALERKEYLDKKHPRTIHEVIQGRRSGKYFVVRNNKHGAHVAEAVNFPDLEQGAATQTLTNYDGKTEPVSGQGSLGETCEAKARRVNKIKSIIKSKE